MIRSVVGIWYRIYHIIVMQVAFVGWTSRLIMLWVIIDINLHLAIALFLCEFPMPTISLLLLVVIHLTSCRAHRHQQRSSTLPRESNQVSPALGTAGGDCCNGGTCLSRVKVGTPSGVWMGVMKFLVFVQYEWFSLFWIVMGTKEEETGDETNMSNMMPIPQGPSNPILLCRPLATAAQALAQNQLPALVFFASESDGVRNRWKFKWIKMEMNFRHHFILPTTMQRLQICYSPCYSTSPSSSGASIVMPRNTKKVRPFLGRFSQSNIAINDMAVTKSCILLV